MVEKNNKKNILKLQRTVRFFEALLRASADGIVITDAAKNIIFVNDIFCKYFSCNRQDVIETSMILWLEMSFPNANERWKELENQTKQNGSARDVEFKVKTEGGIKYFTVNSSLLGQVDIEETGLIISIWRDDTERIMAEEELQRVHDELEMHVKELTAEISSINILLAEEINERKRTEEALMASKEYLRAIIEAEPECVKIVDANGKLVFMNRAGLDMIECENEEGVIGSIVYDLIAPEYRYVWRSFHESICQGNRGKLQFVMLSMKGTHHWMETHAVPIHNPVDGTMMQLSVTRDITESKLNEKKIADSLKEKEILLREIHHRVKNNMQIISSLMELQSGYTINKKNLEMFKDSQNRINSMSLIHEKLHRSKDFTNIDFNEYIRDLADNLFQSRGIDEGRIELILDIDDVTLGIDLAIPCGLIINELITNSLKYAFPDDRKGEVKISFRKIDENLVELVASDNGVGIPDNMDFRTTESLGLHLIIILVEDQLHGHIDMDRSSGTEFRIRFKGVK